MKNLLILSIILTIRGTIISIPPSSHNLYSKLIIRTINFIKHILKMVLFNANLNLISSNNKYLKDLFLISGQLLLIINHLLSILYQVIDVLVAFLNLFQSLEGEGLLLWGITHQMRVGERQTNKIYWFVILLLNLLYCLLGLGFYFYL